MRRLLGWFAFALVWAMLAQDPRAFAQSAQTVLRFNQFTPRTHFYYQQVMEPWIDQVAKATGGRVKIEVTTAPLGPHPRAFDLAKSGIADIAAGSHGGITGRFPLTQITDLGILGTTSAEAASVAFWRTQTRYLEKAKEHEGAHLLTLHTSGSFHFFTRDKQLLTPDDFKGLKIMVLSPAAARLVEGLGGVAITRPITDLYDVLSKGIVDGVITTNTGISGWKGEEFLKYQLRGPAGMLFPTFFVVMNLDKWNALTKADRDAITQVSGEAYAVMAGRVFDAQDKAAFEKRRTTGTHIVDMSPVVQQRIETALHAVEQEWLTKAKAAGLDGAAALNYFRTEATGYRPTN